MHAPDSSIHSTNSVLPSRGSAAVSTDGAVKSRVETRRPHLEKKRAVAPDEGRDGANTRVPGTNGVVPSREEQPGEAEPRTAGDGSGGAGRPRGDSEAVVEGLLTVVRATGLADSAAARRVGVSTSTLGRWKAERPELKAALGMAREEFRARQLEAILHAAGAEQGRGWRAAAWLLERVFPADYARSAAERDKAEQRAQRLSWNEEAEEDVQRLGLQYAERRAAREAAESAAAGEPQPEVAESTPAEPAAPTSAARGGWSEAPGFGGKACNLPGSGSQYSQNAAEPPLPHPALTETAPARTILQGSIFRQAPRVWEEAA